MPGQRNGLAWLVAARSALLLGVLVSCARAVDERGSAGGAASAPPRRGTATVGADAERARALELLRREEADLRAHTDFVKQPPSSRSLGPNPYALVALPAASEHANEPLFAGVLRGDSEVVLLDGRANQLARVASPLSPNGLAALPDGSVFVVGDIEPRVARYRLAGSRLLPDGAIQLPGALSLRAVVVDRRALFVADFWGDQLFSQRSPGARELDPVPRAQRLCGGPIRLALTEHFLGVVCLFEHAIAVFERDAAGLAAREVERVTHDGPIWSLSLLERGDELLLAAGGVEDHPLERRDKAFGYVDSFVYLYRRTAVRRLERVLALNTSELGLVTPKVVKLRAPDASSVRLGVVGYASEQELELEWNGDLAEPPRISARGGVPGCSDAVWLGDGRRVCANPLLDAWVVLEPSAVAVQPSRPPRPGDPSPSERLGEALFFTTLMAPDASSEGRRSRFTCETCHFEGATDGRVHNSGRDAIRVSTRPLLGLLGGAPYFSRAHDRDLTAVSNNEFAVANRGNPVDPWFPLERASFPWLESLGVTAARLEPLELRRALLAFLARFSHAENPLAVRRSPPRRFEATEQEGAKVFRERCVRCHAARLVAREATSEIPFERWEELVLSPEGPIVWSNGEYAKTGVLPYVDTRGTRTPSLRRLYLKRPYLTNGSALTLAALVDNARFSDREFFHQAASHDAKLEALDKGEQSALLAFLSTL